MNSDVLSEESKSLPHMYNSMYTLQQWGTSSRPCGAQKELWGSPVWQEGAWLSGEHALSISSLDSVYSSGTSLGQDLLNWMQLGTRKFFPVSSIIKDLPVSDISCQLHTCKPQRKDYGIVSKFATALYFKHKKKGKSSKKQAFHWRHIECIGTNRTYFIEAI